MRGGYQPLSLPLRLTRTFALVLLATLAAGGLLIYSHALRKVETEMQAAIHVGARIAGNALNESGEVSNRRRRLERLIADFNGDRHLRAVLIGPNGLEMLSSTLTPPVEPAPRWLYGYLSGSVKRVRIRLPAEFEGLGSLELQADSHNEVAEVWGDAKLYFFILIMFCGLILAVLYLALGQALRPLRDLTAAFKQIGDGDYQIRLTISKTPEIAHLERGFNQMSGRLAEMEQRNFRLREQLETIQEEERIELARNLHDDVSPLLFLVDVDAMSICQLASGAEPADVIERARSIQRSVADKQKASPLTRGRGLKLVLKASKITAILSPLTRGGD